jgi:acyl-CoA thioester hydrolase
MYSKQFEIRWSDVDANKHLGNSAYVNFMSNTRMSFLTKMGIGLDVMGHFGIGPIVFYEHIYYFKEVLLGDLITVSLEVPGYSADGRFIKIEHNFYDKNGRNLAYSEMMFSWIDMNTRKLGKIPEELLIKIKAFPKPDNFNILSKEDIRKQSKRPIDLN